MFIVSANSFEIVCECCNACVGYVPDDTTDDVIDAIISDATKWHMIDDECNGRLYLKRCSVE